MPISVFEDRRLLRTVLGAALMAIVVVGNFAGKAYAADNNNNNDDDEDTVDTKFMKNILSGLGLREGNEPGIDYHERSPLVVPPTRDLPPPESNSIAVSNPAWPKDPDITQKKKVKRVRRNTTQEEEDSMRQLMPNELNPASKTQRAKADGPPVEEPQAGVRKEQLTPSQLGHSGFSLGSLFSGRDGQEVKFTKEPERAALTDPPPGLRTPSPRYTYGTKGRLESDKNTGEDQAVFGIDK